MDTEQKLDHSSPIVQRVLLLRERMLQQKTLAATLTPDDSSVAADMTRMKKMYEWQMWQKSDPYAYIEGGIKHRCK